MSWNDFGNALGLRYYGMTKQSFGTEVLQDSWVLNMDALQWQTMTKADIVHMLPPEDFALQQNYPNPFSPATNISCQLAVLVNEKKPAGRYEVSWNAAGFASGMYFYQFEAGSSIETKKLMLLKKRKRPVFLPSSSHS